MARNNIGSTAWKLTANTRGFVQGVNRASKRAMLFKKISVQLRTTLRRLAGTIVAFAGIRGISGAIRSQAQWIDSLGKVSDKLGISTEALAAFRLQAGLSGQRVRTMEMGLQRMIRRMGEAAEGGGVAKDVLEEFGLTAERLANMGTEDALLRIADGIKNTTDTRERLLKMFRLADSEGVGFVNMFLDGSKAIEEARKKSEQFGTALSGRQVKTIELLRDKLFETGEAIRGAFLQAMVRAAPHIIAFLDSVTPLVANLKDLTVTVAEGIGTLKSWGRTILDFVVTPIEGAIKAVRGLSAAVRGDLDLAKELIRESMVFRRVFTGTGTLNTFTSDALKRAQAQIDAFAARPSSGGLSPGGAFGPGGGLAGAGQGGSAAQFVSERAAFGPRVSGIRKAQDKTNEILMQIRDRLQFGIPPGQPDRPPGGGKDGVLVAVSAPIIQRSHWRERFGEVVEIEETVKVEFTGADASELTPSDALATSGLKVAGDSYDDVDYPQLILEDRVPEYISNTPTAATYLVHMFYRLQRQLGMNNFSPAGSATLQQVRTSRDRDGKVVKVANPDKTKAYVAEFDYLEPSVTTVREIVKFTDNPEAFAATLAGSVNSKDWYGGNPNRWLITSVEWERVAPSAGGGVGQANLFRVTFERSTAAIGWVTEVAYKNEDGTIPEEASDASLRGELFGPSGDPLPAPFPHDHGDGPFVSAQVMMYTRMDFNSDFPDPSEAGS